MRSDFTLVLFALLLGLDVRAEFSAREQIAETLRRNIDELHAAMVTAFKRDPAGVGAFYSDAAAIIGGGQRIQGRAGVDNY